MKSHLYHSALSDIPAPTTDVPIDHFLLPNGSIGLVHDLRQPLPREFSLCDIFYSEPPWMSGLKIFDERAGVHTESFQDLIAGISRVITSRPDIPTVLVYSKVALRYLPTPIAMRECSLVGRPAVAMTFNQSVFADWHDEHSIINSLAIQPKFQCVGDFACGFGNVADAFYRRGKRFVASDYNRDCIGMLYRRVSAGDR